MAPKNKYGRQRVDLSAIRKTLHVIASQISDNPASVSLADDPKDAIKNARQIKCDASKLVNRMKKMIKNLTQQQEPPDPSGSSDSDHEISSMQQDPPSQCCYSGAVSFGTARLQERTVPTIFQAMEDWNGREELGAEEPGPEELGFFKCAIGEDVMHMVDPERISGSIVNAAGICQSKLLRLSGLPQKHRLYGLACSVFIEEDSSPEFRVPDLEVNAGKIDYRDLFCSTIEDASKDVERPYFVTEVSSVSDWRESVGLPRGSYLDCGDRLKMTPSRIPGVHSAYQYFSTGKGSCTAMHVEDGYLGSINFVLAGAPKAWLFVQPRYRKEFELKAKEWLKQKGMAACSQFVRHLNKLLSPKLLDQWKIPYYIVPCKAGEMIVTLSQTYHQVVNAGANLAEAVNFAAEPDWVGAPEAYQVCEAKCYPHSDFLPITAAQLRVQDKADDLEPGTDSDENECSSGEDPNGMQDREGSTSEHTQESSPDDFTKDLTEFIDETLQDGQSPSQNSTPQLPRTPPTSNTPASNTPRSRLNTPSGGIDQGRSESRQQTDAPSDGDGDQDESSKGGSDAVASTETVDGRPGSDGHGDNIVDELDGQLHEGGNGDQSGLNAGLPLGSSKSAQGGDGAASRDGSAEAPMQPADDAENYGSNFIELPREDATVVPTPEATGSLNARIDRLLEDALPYLPALGISESALTSFRPDQQLDGNAIKKTLEIILPEGAEPLVAFWAIPHSQSSALSRERTVAEHSEHNSPRLVHNTDSTQLFVAYNVEASSLQQTAAGPGNRWVLIVVDFPNATIHFFGAENGLEATAETIAHNAGVFVNAHRVAEGHDSIKWALPRIQPLYYVGEFTGGSNCGIAVISRAEAFLHHEKALVIPAKLTPEALNQRLDELRASYLDSIVSWCKTIRNQEVVLTDLRGTKRPSPFLGSPEKRSVMVRRTAFARRPPRPSDSNLERIALSATEEWENCILRTAKKQDFNGEGLVKAFKDSPNADVVKVLRALQWACEAASPERLLQVRSALRMGNELSIGQSTCTTTQQLAELHSSIKKYTDVSYFAQYQVLMGKSFYYNGFKALVDERSRQMKIANRERQRLKNYNGRSWHGREPPSTATNDRLAERGDTSKPLTAEAVVKNEIVDGISTLTQRDPKSVRQELDKNLKEGKRLWLFLSPYGDARWKDLRILSLLALYDTQGSLPSLNLLDNRPPVRDDSLSSPITHQDFFSFPQTLVEFLGKHLYLMRPELQWIDPNSLPGSIAPGSQITNMSPESGAKDIVLKVVEEGELWKTKPKDVAQLFKPVKRAIQPHRDLQFR